MNYSATFWVKCLYQIHLHLTARVASIEIQITMLRIGLRSKDSPICWSTWVLRWWTPQEEQVALQEASIVTRTVIIRLVIDWWTWNVNLHQKYYNKIILVVLEHLILRPTLYVCESCSAILYWGVTSGVGPESHCKWGWSGRFPVHEYCIICAANVNTPALTVTNPN